MAAVDSCSDFRVDFITESVVKTVGLTPKPYILTLSNLDLLSGRFPVTYLYFFRSPNQFHSSSPKIIDNLKASLSQCLSRFYPFAGRIVPNPKTDEPEILCDNRGVLVVEAQANIRLKELEFYNLNKYVERGKLVPAFRQRGGDDFAVQIQITRYTCGGLCLTFTFDHALGDASSFAKFLTTWSELATNKPPSCSPDHRRFLLRPRFPPRYNTSLDETFVSCSLDDILNMRPPPTLLSSIMLKRLYYIDASSIHKLQKLASEEDDGIGTSRRRTKIEAFSAYIWKVMVNAVDKSHNKCKMGWLVDGRTRIPGIMSDYIGNVLSLTFGELSMDELKHGTISKIASHVHAAISTATNAEHFLDLIDWIECHRPGLMLSKMVLGRDGPGAAIVVSSGRRFPVGELEFGFGSPVLGTVCSTIERIGVGYVNQRPSARGDGSWTVSAILWPDMVAALESHSECIFQPITAHDLHLS
ncbi:PREDICTED: anthranilate N-benzoyltransferase protein 1-like [Ipomoea nil]|uniref:anthranilate N-benzoyltransferase protein 1-like n=1 Tax=Ipomoea nil TaxID=35883 RepID=UPI00090113C4|nr:PREDICTED: anthranilate N-benzoyltransferase protein 1-like [Ipomoea nil]